MAGESRNISRGDKFTAAQFNDLIRRYNTYWKSIDFDFDGEHTTDLVRKSGWGQAQDVYREVSVSEIITADHINHLIAQMNVGIYHISDDPTLLLSKYSPQASIDASNYETLSNVMDTFFDVRQYEADNIGEYGAPAVTIFNEDQTSPWSDDLVSEFKHTFTNYNHARHYFNSGGQLTIALEAEIFGPQDQTWREILESIGEIRVSADTTTNTGINPGMNLDVGFYGIFSTPTTPVHPDYPNPYPWRTVYEASGMVYRHNGGEYGNEYGGEYGNEYGDEYWVGGEYGSRRVRVQMRAEENPVTGEFELYTRIVLVEDIDDTFDMTAKVTAEVGFLEVFDTPEPNDPNLSYFEVPPKSYTFESPTNPEVEVTLNWTSIDVPAS